MVTKQRFIYARKGNIHKNQTLQLLFYGFNELRNQIYIFGVSYMYSNHESESKLYVVQPRKRFLYPNFIRTRSKIQIVKTLVMAEQ